MTEARNGTLLFVSPAPGDALRAARRLVKRSAIASLANLSWQLQHIEDQVKVDAYDAVALTTAVAEYGRRHQIAGIVTFDERAVVPTATVQEALGLPGNTRGAAYASRNKYIMRSRFSDGGLATPQFQLVRTPQEAVQWATSGLSFPLVLKPLFGMASEGVLRVNDVEELKEAFPVVRRIADGHRDFVGDDRFNDCLLLESYLAGPEVAVDAFVSQGELWPVGIFDKADALEGPTFVETIYVSPSAVDAGPASRIVSEVRKGVAALGLNIGPVHAELRLTAQGPVLLEIGARAIGGVCGRAHTYRLGFDYQEVVLKASLGWPITVSFESQTPSGVMMIPPPGRGRLEAVNGLDRARQVEGVRDAVIMSKPGDLLLGLPEQGCYVGFIFATGISQEEVVSRLRESHARLSFSIAPVDDGETVRTH